MLSNSTRNCICECCDCRVRRKTSCISSTALSHVRLKLLSVDSRQAHHKENGSLFVASSKNQGLFEPSLPLRWLSLLL